LLANFHKLIVNQREHFGGTHSRSRRSHRSTFSFHTTFAPSAAFTPRPTLAVCTPRAARAFHRVPLCHLCSYVRLPSLPRSDVQVWHSHTQLEQMQPQVTGTTLAMFDRHRCAW